MPSPKINLNVSLTYSFNHEPSVTIRIFKARRKDFIKDASLIPSGFRVTSFGQVVDHCDDDADHSEYSRQEEEERELSYQWPVPCYKHWHIFCHGNIESVQVVVVYLSMLLPISIFLKEMNRIYANIVIMQSKRALLDS